MASLLLPFAISPRHHQILRKKNRINWNPQN